VHWNRWPFETHFTALFSWGHDSANTYTWPSKRAMISDADRSMFTLSVVGMGYRRSPHVWVPSVRYTGRAIAFRDDRPSSATAAPNHPAASRNSRRPVRSPGTAQGQSRCHPDHGRRHFLSDIGKRYTSQRRQRPQDEARRCSVVQSDPFWRLPPFHVTLLDHQQRAVGQQQNNESHLHPKDP
jgi:hypothetical protein